MEKENDKDTSKQESIKHTLYSIDGDRDRKLNFVYFVHFIHSEGSAWLELGAPKEIMGSADIIDIQNYIAHNTSFMRPMIVNWKLLRKDKV